MNISERSFGKREKYKNLLESIWINEDYAMEGLVCQSILHELVLDHNVQHFVDRKFVELLTFYANLIPFFFLCRVSLVDLNHQRYFITAIHF